MSKFKIATRRRTFKFDTIGEANQFANDYFRNNKVVLAVEPAKKRIKGRKCPHCKSKFTLQKAEQDGTPIPSQFHCGECKQDWIASQLSVKMR